MLHQNRFYFTHNTYDLPGKCIINNVGFKLSVDKVDGCIPVEVPFAFDCSAVCCVSNESYGLVHRHEVIICCYVALKYRNS